MDSFEIPVNQFKFRKFIFFFLIYQVKIFAKSNLDFDL